MESNYNYTTLKRKRGRPCKRPKQNAPSFFKIILHQTLQEKKMKIPDKFVREYGSKLVSPAVNLVDPVGTSWEVSITRSGDDVWFDHRWSELVEFYSIEYGHFLVFEYDGKSRFDFKVFDKSTCDIDYGSCRSRSVGAQDKGKQQQRGSSVPRPDHEDNSKASETKNETHHVDCGIETIDLEDDHDTIKFLHNKRLVITIPTPISGHGHGPSHSEERIQTYVSTKFMVDGEYSPEERTRAVCAAKTIKPRNPSFLVIMRKNAVNGTVYVPAAFTKAHLSEISTATIADGDGRKWTASMTPRIGGGYNMNTDFCRGANLKVGDVCIFELIEAAGDRELKVSTFPAP